MTEVSIRDVRSHGGDIVDRAARGERITITRSGKPVAELSPVRPPGAGMQAILDRWRTLPKVEQQQFREDVAAVLDATL
ncbi:MAG: type II toxin-antitoxin system Phd/YefM family antitoxin [Angustibacter sp.]